jgi:exopolyphosphatase/guanosine-5'-triphosphate,3'-diphosphate pyrophosphatase
MTRIAAIDVGSLTVRLAVAEVIGAGRFRVVLHRREVTGLGRGLSETGVLARDAVQRTLAALAEFAGEIRRQEVSRTRAVATQAARQAMDGAQFLQRAAEVLGGPVALISPEEEARLTLKGVRSALEPQILQQGPVVVFDLGGGSSEFVLLTPGREPYFAGLPLGVLNLSGDHAVSDPPRPEEVAALHQEVALRLQIFYKEAFTGLLPQPPTLVGTAGAVTTLAAMAQEMTVYEARLVNNYRLTQRRLEELAQTLVSLPECERARLPGMEPAKAGVMVAGALMVMAILRTFGQDGLITIDAGLLEGLLQDLAQGGRAWRPPASFSPSA